MPTDQSYGGFGVPQSEGTSCGAGFQPALLSLRERLHDLYLMAPDGTAEKMA